MSKTAYWRFQILWWLLYSAAGLAINAAFGARLVPLLIVHLIWVGASIGLTHAFRAIIDRGLRPDRSAWRRWPILTAGILAIAALQTAIVVGVSGDRWSLSSVAAVAWGMFLGTGFWTLLYIRITERQQQKQRERKLQETAAEAELRALEAQINPHFLFNCLNSIRALVAEDPARAQDMITRLANIFRYNLRREPAHTVPLSSEVEVVGDYLALESVRFEDRLRVKIAVSPDAGKTQVPSMLLQALVENALKHGIAPRPAGGDLLIRAQRERDATVIEVENPGQLAPTGNDEPGVGLANTRERLRILYGGRASLDVRNQEDNRVVAKVLIPAGA